MSFVRVRYTTAVAVAQNGTISLSYPLGTNVGSFAGARGTLAFVEGLQGLYSSSPTEFMNSSGVKSYVAPAFSLAFGANIVVTWLNTTPIPAGAAIEFQFELIGMDVAPVFVTKGSVPTIVQYVNFGAPATASTTAVLATTAVLTAALFTLATPYQVDVPRNLTYVSSSAGDTTQTVTVRGFDVYGVPMTEAVTMNGVTPVVGKKAFSVVTSYQASAALAGTLSLGTGVVFGMPFVLNRKRLAFAENVDDATVTTGTFVIADAATPTATTGDIRGTYAPSAAPNGAHIYELLCAAPDQVARVLQFS